MKRRRVWIDTDPAITAGNGEVDDAFALIQALRSPELEIVGISAVYGNTDVDHTFAMAREIVERAGRSDVPVYRGCAGAGAGQANPATAALVAAIGAGPLTIAALGPLTTIAGALTHVGAVLANVEEIVFVGGRRAGLEFRATPDQPKPFRDLNFELDPAAATTLLALGAPLTLAGWEVASAMWLTPADLDAMAAAGDVCVQWLAASARPWLAIWQKTMSAPGFTPFDTLAIGWLLHPDLFQSQTWPARVENSGPVPQLIADPDGEGATITYLSAVDNDAFRADLLARLTGSTPSFG